MEIKKDSFTIKKPPLSKAMYEDPYIAKQFAIREKEDTKNHTIVSGILDEKIIEYFEDKSIKIANLGGGGNPQKYEGILKKIQEGSEFDLVDISSGMLDSAKEEIKKLEESNSPYNINYIKSDFVDYLKTQKDESLDCVMMQYAINHIEDINIFFEILVKKLKKDGIFIANLGANALQNSENTTFLINGKEFDGRKELKDGDRYTIQFLNPDGTIFSSAEKNFFSNQIIESTSKYFGLEPKIEKIQKFEILILKK